MNFQMKTNLFTIFSNTYFKKGEGGLEKTCILCQIYIHLFYIPALAYGGGGVAGGGASHVLHHPGLRGMSVMEKVNCNL